MTEAVTLLQQVRYVNATCAKQLCCLTRFLDINKIIRAAYGSQVEYQELALNAITHWKRWNEQVKQGTTLPPELTTKDVLFINNGSLTMTSDESLPQFEKDTMENMSKAGLAKTQVLLTNPSDVRHATANGFGFAVNPFYRTNNFGVLDIQGGFVYADKACWFALHKAKTLGVQVILGGAKGTFSNFLGNATSRITGVRTADDVSHSAELVIMACGGWTPSLVTQLDNVCETTAGSICIFQLPTDSTLWDRFAPKNFPTWT
jgi:sarcosine oxidase / L-pipecolate oxidase